MGHEDAAEEHRHDTGGMHTLGKEVRGVGKHNEGAGLEHGVLAELGVLEDQGAEAADEGANREGAKEDPNKVAETKEDA